MTPQKAQQCRRRLAQLKKDLKDQKERVEEEKERVKEEKERSKKAETIHDGYIENLLWRVSVLNTELAKAKNCLLPRYALLVTSPTHHYSDYS